MGIFPGGKSTRINSPRHLTIRHARRMVALSRRKSQSLLRSAAPPDDGGDDIDPLPAGQQQLSSYWAPGLEAGQQHRVTVSQTIDAQNGDGTLSLAAEQDFFVDAPQFSLPDGSVHSTYPPAGYSDDHRILPHVVLTDPHLPWERLGSPKAGSNADLRAQASLLAAAGSGDAPARARNRVPWLVVFSFSQDELRLPPDDLASIFANTSAGVIKPVKQSSTMTVNMSIADLWQLTGDVATPVTPALGPDTMQDSRGDFIFVKPDLFTSLFSTFDENGSRAVPSAPDTSQYQYLAHVRKINGSGMALAGVEDTAVFSIVVGNRSGPLDNALPTTMCVHVVSIEGVEHMKLPIGDQQRYVALCSLHSWNYTVMPPGTLNVPDAFEHLGSTLDVLRAPESVIAPLRTAGDKIRQRIAARLQDGYTLAKYRPQTGEATVALYRGPFTPTAVSELENLTQCSSSGVDLQILDKDLGIMDITYSVAWQVGRTMALGDEVCTAALNRLRTSIHTPAVRAVKLQTVKEIEDGAIRTRNELLGDLPNMVKSLAAVHVDKQSQGGDNLAPPEPGQPLFSPGGARKRWLRPRLDDADKPNLSFTSPAIGAKYPAAALQAARSLASSKSAAGLYDETNDPQSTDWMIVLSWLVDRMFLAGVPAHCLLVDPTYLAPESLRFFCIDRNWVDAMLDGALSLGNHSLVDDDRVAIKLALNDYIGHTPDGLGHRIQIPSYGFYLRSDLVTMFPDLRVEVLPDDDALRAAGQDPPAGAPLLRHDIVADGVMMGFMDRLPGSAQFGSLVFTQPAHQQRFAVARGLEATGITVDIRRQYTVDQTTRETDKDRHVRLDEIEYAPTGTDNIFVWGSEPGQGLNDLRILRLPKFAHVQLTTLQEKMGTYDDGGAQKPYFQDDTATSALFSMQLNDPIYNLTIDLNAHPTAAKISDLGPSGGTGSPEIRTLRQLEAARVARSPAGDQEDGSGAPSRLPSAGDSDGESTFQRHESYAPTPTALSANLSPHLRAITTLSPDDLPTPGAVQPADPQGDPAAAPKYNITISSNIGSHWDVITLEKPNLQQDIIFSIVLQQNQSSQYKLVELDVQINLGPPSTASNPTNFLMQTYAGPGSMMLTNLRFNVLPQILDDGGQRALRLRVLPRAAKGWIDVTTVRELSFLLGLATINQPLSSVDQIEVQSWADYCSDPENPQLGPDNTTRIHNNNTRVTVVVDPN